MSDIENMEWEMELLRKRLEMRDKQIDAMHRISAALYSQKDLASMIRETLLVALAVADSVAGSILLYDRDRRRLVFRYVIGNVELLGQEIDPEKDVNGRAAAVFRTGQSLLTTNTQEEGYNAHFDGVTGFRTQSIITVPLKNLDGETIGVLQTLNKRHGDFDEDDLELLEIIAGMAATTIVSFQMAEEAQLSAVARAVGDLSHDIKNALTPIETTVETTVQAFLEPLFEDIDTLDPNAVASVEEFQAKVLNAMEPLRDWCPEMLSAMRDGCGDIREMVGEIADYIKGAQATHMERGDIAKVVQERLHRLRVVSRDRRITLHLEDLKPVPEFPFDRRLVGRAVYNLVNNALGAIYDAVRKGELEFRPAGYHIYVRLVYVDTGTFPTGRFCKIEVADDGPGIPQRVLDSLFTAHTISTTPGGTGIGTRFVRSVADAHLGRAGVESVVGEGARFWLLLPLDQEVTLPEAAED
jgi:signal transduction histidine kinase